MVAQNYADQCVFQHNSDRNSQQSAFTFIGENLFASSRDPANLVDMVQAWYDEVQDYDYATGACSHQCGHYTQVNFLGMHFIKQNCYLLHHDGHDFYPLQGKWPFLYDAF